MKRWSTPGEAFAYETGYIEGRADIVRCKDCKHNSLKRMTGNAFCELGIGLSQIYDFCSMGERREDA